MTTFVANGWAVSFLQKKTMFYPELSPNGRNVHFWAWGILRCKIFWRKPALWSGLRLSTEKNPQLFKKLSISVTSPSQGTSEKRLVLARGDAQKKGLFL